MRSPGFVVLSFTLGALTAYGKGRCPERVQQLRDLREVLSTEAHQRKADHNVPLSELAKGAAVEIPKRDGPRVFVVRAGEAVKVDGAKALAAIRALRAAGEVKVCTIAKTPKPLVHANAADAAERAKALKVADGVPPPDRATLFAAALGEVKVGKVGECPGVVSAIAPNDKPRILVDCVVEELEKAGCPDAGAERVFALLTLVLDNWDYSGPCVAVPAKVPDVPAAKTFGELQAALKG